MKGIVGVATFSRAGHLDNCLASIVKAKGSREISLIVVHQLGDPEVKEIIAKWRPHIQFLIELDSKGKNALQNINFNSILLRSIAFDIMESDWFLGVEEDVVIGGDSIAFIECMMKKYFKKKAFRGVNLGSNLPRDKFHIDQYSKIRYGMQGQASAITQRTWKKFKINRLNQNSLWNGLDGIMENKLKSGFMTTPLLSRYLDEGWGGTHGFGDPEHEYYQLFERSFIDLPENHPIDYVESKIKVPLREDAVLYRPISSLLHVINNFIFYNFHITLRRFFFKLTAQIKAFSKP